VIESQPDIDAARRLVNRADGDPESVRRDASRLLAGVEPGDELSPRQALAAWALGLALRHLRELRDARVWLERAAATFGPGTEDHTQVVLTLTGTMAFLGELHEADEMLRQAAPSPSLAGRVVFQRAAIAERLGDLDRAALGYRSALERFRATGDRLGEAHALSGIALTDLEQGVPSRSVEAFSDARQIYLELDLPMLAATARHNEGLAAMRCGNLIRAIELLEQAEGELDALGQPFVETALDHVEALLLLGRPEAAADRARRALELLIAAGASTDRAEMLTVLALALHESSQADVAIRALDTADHLFAQQDRGAWSSLVELRREQCRPDNTTRKLTALSDIGLRLRETGMGAAATEADAALLEAVAQMDDDGAADQGAVNECVQRLTALDAANLHHAHATMFEAGRQGEDHEAVRIARTALADLETRLIEPTPLDVRCALVAQRDRIVRLGVRSAGQLNDAWFVVEVLATVQRAALQPPGSEPAHDGDADEAPATADGIHASLESVAGDTDFVAVVDDGSTLTTVRFADDGPEFVESPARDDVVRTLERHSGLLASALGHGSSAHDDDLLTRSADAVRAVLPWLAGDRPLALALSGSLSTAPWTSLATRPTRVVSVLAPGRAATGRTVVVTGPGLTTADDEADALSATLGADCVAGLGAPSDSIEQARSGTLHLCCHGHHDHRNPLLSSYQLHGGELTGAEIVHLAAAPALVIAAACRAGTSRPIGRHLSIGLPTAWLVAGATSVIAPVLPLPDDLRTVRTMAALHRSLADGRTPEQAVFDAGRDGDHLVARALSVFGRLPPTAVTAS
jgi:tetratricopeptide (TPR) repeat protein